MRRFALFVTLLSIYAPGVAFGNGRFPKAQVIDSSPGPGGLIALRATFGLLLSRDEGKSWSWLCEEAYGTSSTWDPPFALTRDGDLFIGMPDGLRQSSDACTVLRVPGLEHEMVTDLAADGAGRRLFAATSKPGGGARVFAETEAGAWEARGSLPGVRVDTLDVAPSRASRVYVTAVPEGTSRSRLYRSDDGGRHLVDTNPKMPVPGRVFVAAVDPASPDRLLVRILHDTGSVLAVSSDAGASFHEVLRMAGAMLGFARSEDGATMWAGSGDPAEGLFRSKDRGEHWQLASKTGVFCLHARAGKLYACSNPYVPGGYAVGVSVDEGGTFTPLATFDAILGAVSCDAGGGAACSALWPATRGALAASGKEFTDKPENELVPVDAGAIAPPDAGAGTGRARSCGCAAVGRKGPPDGRLFLSLLLMLGVANARRARGSRGLQGASRRPGRRARRSSERRFIPRGNAV